MWTDPELVLRVTDRQFELLLQANGSRRLRLLPGLLAFLEREPLTNQVLIDLVEEANQSLSVYHDACASARAKLLALTRIHYSALRSALEPYKDEPDLNDFAEIDNYEDSLENPPRIVTLPAFRIGGEILDQGALTQAKALQHWAKWASDIEKARPLPSWLKELRRGADDIERELQHAFRSTQLAAECQSGFALLRLRDIVASINPDPHDVFSLAARESYHQSIYALGGQQVTAEVQNHVTEVVAHVTSLKDGIHQRLLLGLSRRAVIGRFAARCETFHRDRLRSAARKGKSPERQLTLEFAAYLFDCGFTPILDPQIGGLKPDVIDAARTSLFYIEAKQYSSPSPQGRLVKAYHQVWSTWLRLEQQYQLREGFLVVFRLGGPLVVLPKRITLGERLLYSTLIDLCPNAGSSEQRLPIHLDPSKLVPPHSTAV